MRERAREEAADEVDHRLEILHRGHRIVGSSVRVDEVRAHERGAVAELGLGALALLLDDPGDGAVVARVEQLAHDRAPQRSGATGHEHTHDRGG